MVSTMLSADIRFELAVSRMKSLEKALRSTNAYLEKERYVSVMEELADAYKEVNRLAQLIDLSRDVEGFQLVEIQSELVVGPVTHEPAIFRELEGYCNSLMDYCQKKAV